MKEKEKVCREVKQASRLWVGKFNQGDSEYCAHMYTNDAEMQVRPLGNYTGRPQIHEFWRGMIQRGAKDLKYDNILVVMQDRYTARLSATWSMNIGEGFISYEKWIYNQDQHMWLLKEDDFTITAQYSPKEY